MPTVETNEIQTYYERYGQGQPLVCIHGAWTDHRLWNAQLDELSTNYEVVVYDVRGHGKTGSSAERRYTIDLFAADLHALVEELRLEQPIICGLSLGGMIAQTYAVRYGDRLRALILADTAVSTTLTVRDKLTRLVFPGWAMRGTVWLLGPSRYVDVAYWLANVTRGKDWFGRDETVRSYVRETMSSFDTTEFNKIFRAIYDFRQVDLTKIGVPTLVLNGEYESRAVFTHTTHMTRMIPDVRTAEIPDAGHTSNMENPEAFNREVLEFLSTVIS